MSWWKGFLLAFFIFVILPIAIYGVYTQIRVSRQVVPIIYETLIRPYFSSIVERDYQFAYERFISERMKKAYSLADFISGQERNLQEFGPLKEVKLRETDTFQSAGNLFDGRRYYQGELVYIGSKATTNVNLEVVLQDGHYKLDAIYEHPVGLEGMTRRIF